MRALRLAGLALLALAAPALAQSPAQSPARPAARPAAEAPAAAPAPEKPLALRLEATVPLRGPAGRFGAPAVDEANRRIYLPRGPAGLTVLALDGFRQLAEIPDTAGSFAVALDPETLRGFALAAPEPGPEATPATALATAGALAVFDQRSFKPVPNVPEPVQALRARHLLYDAATRQLATVAEDGTLTLIDPAKLAITGTIALPGKRVTALATDRRGRLFATLADQDAIAVVNLVSREVAATWKPEGCRLPAAMVFDSVGMRLVVACRGGRAEGARPEAEPAREAAFVIDPLGGGRVLGRLPIPAATETLIHDPAQRLLYAASASAAAIAVFRQPDPFRYEPLETVGTRPLTAFGAADPRTGRLILATAEYVVPAPRPEGPSALRLLPNSYTLLVMRRLPLE